MLAQLPIASTTFEFRLPFSTVKKSEDDADASYDLITFLAVAQKLRLGLLPITWTSRLQIIGKGSGRSQINQTLINLQTSFAFKRVADKDKQNVAQDWIFRSLVNEIIALRSPSLRNHPFIVELEGFCWDVPFGEDIGNSEAAKPDVLCETNVWPALVFEKSQYGDLYQFASTPVGRRLGVIERVNLCLSIGKAIVDLHANHIVHGDIKPQNILLFYDNNTAAFIPKVIDFGHSTRYAREDSIIHLGWTWPWNAPEHDIYPSFTPDQARKTDVFSLGMLWLWLLFQDHFYEGCEGGEAEPLPMIAEWTKPCLAKKSDSDLLNFLDNLKREENLIPFSRHLLIMDKNLGKDYKLMLERFFCASLACDASSRALEIRDLMNLSKIYQPQSPSKDFIEDSIRPLGCDYKMSYYMAPIYHSDYRVRFCITRCLQSRTMTSQPNPLFLQLALCFKIGCGCQRSDEKSQQLIRQNGTSEIEFQEAVEEIKNATMTASVGAMYSGLRSMGHLSTISFYDYYFEHRHLVPAKLTIEQEIKELKSVFGGENDKVLLLETILSMVLRGQGALKEVEELDVHIMETRRKLLGSEHPATLTSMNNLASTYESQGRFKASRELGEQVVKSREKVLGVEHPDTLTSKIDLAATLSQQGLYIQAKEILGQVVDARRKVLGSNHHATTTAMHNIGLTLLKLGRFSEAEELNMQVVNIRKEILGLEHPHTLISMGNLALIFWYQGRWEEAEKLNLEVLKSLPDLFSAEHYLRFSIMGNLGATYRSQGRLKEAEELDVQLINGLEEEHDPGHPEILRAKGCLASTFQSQRRWKDAEELGLQVVKGMSQEFGTGNPDTLTAMANLAFTYRNQRRWKDAEDLEVPVLDASSRLLGKDHPETLTTMNNLAWTLKHQGREDEALALIANCVQLRISKLGMDHPFTKDSADTLNKWKRKSE